MDKDNLKPLIESLIFASEGVLTLNGIFGVMPDEDRAEVKAALKELIEDYRRRAGGLLIEEVAGGYRFHTNPEFSAWIRRLFKSGAQKLSRPAMETLAIVAYKQPVTRGELEAVRGVDSGGVLATLMEKRLIKITGKKEVPGRPVVYGTTREFLETFDLKDLGCLPSLKDIQALEEENAGQREQAGQEGVAPEAPASDGPEAGTDEGPGAGPEGGPDGEAEGESNAWHEAKAQAAGQKDKEEEDPSSRGSA